MRLGTLEAGGTKMVMGLADAEGPLVPQDGLLQVGYGKGHGHALDVHVALSPRMSRSIARAASLPAPIARMTVAEPVTASPPA